MTEETNSRSPGLIAAEQFFKEKHPEDIAEFIKILDDGPPDTAIMQTVADASRIGKSIPKPQCQRLNLIREMAPKP
jgi:hypothetical protein